LIYLLKVKVKVKVKVDHKPGSV